MKKLPNWMLVVPAVFAMAWGGNHFTPLLHLYESVGHYSTWQANLLLGMYVLGLIPGLLIAAAASDQSGRKPLLFVGLVAGMIGSLLLGFGLHSFSLLCTGRAFAGIGVGIAMSVGTSWIKELSGPNYDNKATEGSGAKRPALTLTLGFAVGAGVTGVLAQWGPNPSQLPYLVHLLLSLAGAGMLWFAPETLAKQDRSAGPWWRDLTVPAARQVRFVRLVVPAAPWIFGAAGVAYAIMPAIAAPKLGDSTTVYATVLTVLTLGSGALIQPFVTKLDAKTSGKGLPIGLTIMTIGMLLAVFAAQIAEPILALVVAIVLGIAYGIVIVSGLSQVQAMASPSDLAGLTGIYYSLAYTGFLLPTLLAAMLPISPYSVSLGFVAIICAICLVIVLTGLRKYPIQNQA